MQNVFLEVSSIKCNQSLEYRIVQFQTILHTYFIPRIRFERPNFMKSLGGVSSCRFLKLLMTNASILLARGEANRNRIRDRKVPCHVSDNQIVRWVKVKLSGWERQQAMAKEGGWLFLGMAKRWLLITERPYRHRRHVPETPIGLFTFIVQRPRRSVTTTFRHLLPRTYFLIFARRLDVCL